MEVSFVGPGPLAASHVKFTYSALGVVRVAPEVVPVARVNCEVLNWRKAIMLVT